MEKSTHGVQEFKSYAVDSPGKRKVNRNINKTSNQGGIGYVNDKIVAKTRGKSFKQKMKLRKTIRDFQCYIAHKAQQERMDV